MLQQNAGDFFIDYCTVEVLTIITVAKLLQWLSLPLASAGNRHDCLVLLEA